MLFFFCFLNQFILKFVFCNLLELNKLNETTIVQDNSIFPSFFLPHRRIIFFCEYYMLNDEMTINSNDINNSETPDNLAETDINTEKQSPEVLDAVQVQEAIPEINHEQAAGNADEPAPPETPAVSDEPAPPDAETNIEANTEVDTEVNTAANSEGKAEEAQDIPAAAAADDSGDTAITEEASAEAEKDVREKEIAEKKKAEEAEKEKKMLDEVFEKLKTVKENNETIEVEIKARIRGGLRAMYDNFPLFLPASHYSLKRKPREDVLRQAVGQKFNVNIHEIQEDESNRRTVIVSRKKIIGEEFWSSLNVGDIVEGTVSAIATFGVFLDLGGVEGLIHISRLSQVHIDNTKNFAKKGDKMKAVIIEFDKEKNRIALSRKELEESPWKEVETKFVADTVHKGIVRRLTDFGAYVELLPGVDGLLRTAELSWTKRINRPADLLKPGDEIEVYVISSSEEKKAIALSLKRTLENPWTGLAERYPIGTELKGIVSKVLLQKGAIITIAEDIDGFMPRSKMAGLNRGKKIPFQAGDELDIVIADIVPEEESLILSLNGGDDEQSDDSPMPERRRSGKKESARASRSNAFSIGDLISEKAKKSLADSNK